MRASMRIATTESRAFGLSVSASARGVAEALEGFGRKIAVAGVVVDSAMNLGEEFANRDRSLPEQLLRGGTHTLLTSGLGTLGGVAGAAGGGAAGALLGPPGAVAGGIAAGTYGALQASDIGDRLFILVFGP